MAGNGACIIAVELFYIGNIAVYRTVHNVFIALPSLGSVSYTHLDVDKRQAFADMVNSYVRNGTPFLGMTSIADYEAFLRMCRAHESGKRLPRGSVPVSYTHLDVYKRQADYLDEEYTHTREDALDWADTPSMAGKWFHVALTMDGETKTRCLYVNGTLVGEDVADSVDANLLKGTIEIGSWKSDMMRYFYGMLDEFRLYDRALTQDEVRELTAQVENVDVVPEPTPRPEPTATPTATADDEPTSAATASNNTQASSTARATQAAQATSSPAPEENSGSMTWLWIVLVVAVVLAIVLFVVFKKKKK